MQDSDKLHPAVLLYSQVMMQRVHNAHIGVPVEHREGRYIVSTTKCIACGHVWSERIERPRFIDHVAAWLGL